MWFRKVYSLYALIVFSLLFALFFPVFLVLIAKKEWHKYSYAVDHIWGNVFFFLIGIRTKVIGKEHLKAKGPYIFVANHFSFLDIAVFCFLNKPYAFVGKSSLAKVPLFGYMFRKLHVPINRSSLKSKYNSMVKAGELLDSGRSVVIFPEGGIVSKHFPNMVPFKDGAFKLAIEKQIPIVPVSIPWNWIILPDDGNYVLRCRKNMLIFHPPISTKGMSPDDLNQLKQKTFDTINSELKKWN